MKETLPPLGGGINFEAGDKYISVCRGNLAPAGFPFGLGVCPYYPVLGAQQLLISSVPGSGTDSWDPEWNLGSALPVRSRWTCGLVGPGPPEPISVCVPSGYHSSRPGHSLSLSSGLSRRTRAPGAYLCVRTKPVPLSSTRTFRPFRSELLKGFLLALSLAFLGSEGNVCSGLLLRSRRTLALRSPSLCAHHNGCRSLRPGRTVRSGRLCHGLLVGLEPCPCPSPWCTSGQRRHLGWQNLHLSLSHMGFWLALSLALALALGGTSGQRRHLGWQISISLSLSLLRPSPGLSPSQLPPTLSLPLHLLSLLRFPPGELWVR
ncbi:hypothetical protein BSL78_21039 [Apostichopus japonicus]|uniref:Uncharacterized protein n=1 Tax=Stichopus japonicus TaxID=307972 RepID=A0A2G8K2C4_STIJA|nr:hypothetical protein BSL78_21039 [Apostichopus japonicus]